MKKLALWLTISGPILFAVGFKVLMLSHPKGDVPPNNVAIFAPLMVFGVVISFIGPVLFTFNLSLEKRKKIAAAILIVALALMASGYYLGHQEYLEHGENEEEYSNTGLYFLVIGVLLFSFSYLTLLLKNKYDRWKIYTRSKRDAFFLSLVDSLGFSFLFLGVMFRIVHWPGANVLGLVGVVLIIVGMIAWNQRMKKEVVHRKEAEDKLQESYRQIEEKQKEITDSITYAKRIQHSLLAHEEFLKEHLPDHFVLYMPKDIVSGDFYWSTVAHDSVYLAVCDSTGHGVPGAFMSLLNISFLNEAINEKNIASPEQVLDYVRMKLIENISHDGARDGMDGILLRMERGSGKVTYAASNNAPVLVNGTVSECAYDKMPVGKGEHSQPFVLHEVNAAKGSTLYLSTDGFADQFGGPGGKKYKRSKLREKLSSISSMPLPAQQKDLRASFLDWKGNLEQVDDVCIIGLRF